MFHHRKKKSENWRCPICERKFYIPTCPHSLQDVARYEKMNEKWVPTGELRVLVGEPGEYRVLQQMMENKSGEVRWMNVTEISREEEMLDTKKGEVPEFCVSLSDGKYMYRRFRGKQDCLRYGKPWREMTGDNLVYFMGLEIEELQGRLRQLQNELLEVRRPTKACY